MKPKMFRLMIGMMFSETKDVQTYDRKDVLRDQDVQLMIGRMFSETKMFGQKMKVHFRP